MKKPLFILLFLFVLVNSLSACFTQLYVDESYYWMYSQYLDWGYFDHPPMVALMIKVGYFLFPNEFGVRIVGIILSAASVYLVRRMAKVKNDLLFGFLIFGSLTYGMLTGFLATPDIPMLFFTTLFLFQYKKYLEQDSFVRAIYLGVICAALLYSKYHGVLLIGFTVLSNFSLLKRKSFWLIVLLSIVLLIPHIVWQFQNDFPSYSYHMVERSNRPYKFQYTSDYVLGLLAYNGPLIIFVLLIGFFRKKISDSFERALRFVVIGVWAFFFISTFKGRVEPNWLLVAFPSFIVFSFPSIENSHALAKWLKILAIPTIIVLVFLRVYFITDIPAFTKTFNVNTKKDRAAGVKGQREFAQKVMKVANGLPIVTFKYQMASSLSFYTGTVVSVERTSDARKSQYDIWNFQEKYKGQPVLYVSQNVQSDTMIVGMQEKKFYLKTLSSLDELNKY